MKKSANERFSAHFDDDQGEIRFTIVPLASQHTDSSETLARLYLPVAQTQRAPKSQVSGGGDVMV